MDIEIQNMIICHKNSSEEYIQLVDKLVKEQCFKLDSLINNINVLIERPDYEIQVSELQSYYLKLSTELYLMVDKLKQFEVYSSLSKINADETFNRAYLDKSISITNSTGKKPAAADLQVLANNESSKQSLVNTVYNSALKDVKGKMDAGNLLADTLKNIIRTRVSLDFSAKQ